MLLLMPKRKARKGLFSSDDARRKAARVQLETENERFERLSTTKERMAISRSADTEERRYEMMHRGMRHEEVQKLHVDDMHVFTLITHL